MADYANPIYTTHSLAAVSFTGAAGAKMNVSGPAGKVGRIVGLSVNLTTATTVAASGLKVGTIADDDAYATLAVPIAAINTVLTGMVDLQSDTNLIPADSGVVVTGNGGSTAGAGTVTLIIAWF